MFEDVFIDFMCGGWFVCLVEIVFVLFVVVESILVEVK